MACVRSQSTLLRLQVALQGNCPKWALGCVHFPGLSHSSSGSWLLHKGTDSVGPAFYALPGPSSSGNQMLGKHTLPAGWCILSPPRFQPLGCLGLPKNVVSGVPCVSSGCWSLTATFLVDVNHPRSQEDFTSNWKPAHSLVENAMSGSEIAPCLPALAVARLPLCLQQGERPVHSWLALLWYLLNPLFCERARLCLRTFHGKFSLSFFLSGYFYSLGFYLTLAPSDRPQGVQAQSPPYAWSPRLPVQCPSSLLADASVRDTSPLGVMARHVICGFFCFTFLLVMLPSEIPKLSTDPLVRGFTGVWKLLLLQDSLPGVDLHP